MGAEMCQQLKRLVDILPEHVQCAAIVQYLQELASDGDRKRLYDIVKQVRTVQGCPDTLKGESFAICACEALHCREKRQALGFYQELCGLKESTHSLVLRAQVLSQILQHFLPESMDLMADLWSSLVSRPLPAHAQYLCARSGRLLLQMLCRNGRQTRAMELIQLFHNMDAQVCKSITCEVQEMVDRERG